MPNWSQDQEFKLLLNIIYLTNPKPPNWGEVAGAMGSGFTKEACRQHYQKIKRETKGTASSSGPTTPSKNGIEIPKTPSSKSAKRKAGYANGSEHVDDDANGANGNTIDVDESPLKKKMKSEPEQTGLQFKAEIPDAEVVDLEDQSLYV